MKLASFDFATLALRYAQDERGKVPQPFVLSVAERGSGAGTGGFETRPYISSPDLGEMRGLQSRPCTAIVLWRSPYMPPAST